MNVESRFKAECAACMLLIEHMAISMANFPGGDKDRKVNDIKSRVILDVTVLIERLYREYSADTKYKFALSDKELATIDYYRLSPSEIQKLMEKCGDADEFSQRLEKIAHEMLAVVENA